MFRALMRIGLAGAAQEALWVSLHIPTPLREHTASFLTLILALFAVCVWSFFRLPIVNRRDSLCVVLFGLLFRLTVLPASPDQSEDVYRYLWDARVASEGISPFAYPPQAPELSALRDERIYPALNSKPYLTAYPPVSQLLFRWCSSLFGARLLPLKAMFGLFEFATLLLVWLILEGGTGPRRGLLLMAWNPFFVFEFWHSGHSDSAALFLMLLSVFLLGRGRRFPAMAAWAGAVMSKLHPALGFPLYVRRAGWVPQIGAAAAAATLLALYFTPSSLARYLHSLRLYYSLFEFNASIHYVARFAGRVLFDTAWDQKTGPYLLAALVLASAGLWLRFPVRSAGDVLHGVFWLMVADLCLATTVHPWYLSWAALALPLFPYAFMMYWTGAVFLSYAAYAYRPVFEPTWVLLVEYLPMYALMIWEIRRRGPQLHSLDFRNTR